MSFTVVLVVVALAAVGALWWSLRTISLQRERIRELLDERRRAADAADRLRATLESMERREKEVRREEKEINESDDADLAGRANALFPGLRDESEGK